MAAGKANRTVKQIAQELIRLRQELLEQVGGDNDLELTLAHDREHYTIRVLWNNCVLVASDRQRRESGQSAEHGHKRTLRLHDLSNGTNG